MVGSSNWKGQCSNWSWGRAERYFCLWAKIILGTIHEFGSPVSTEYQWKGEVLILEATWMFKNVKEIQTRWQHPQKFDFQKTLLFSPSSPSCDLLFHSPLLPDLLPQANRSTWTARASEPCPVPSKHSWAAKECTPWTMHRVSRKNGRGITVRIRLISCSEH